MATNRNKQDGSPSISVLLLDGSTPQLAHTAPLNIPQLPPAHAREAHTFPTLISGSLISVGKLCAGNGCTASFTATHVQIQCNEQVIPQGETLWQHQVMDLRSTNHISPNMRQSNSQYNNGQFLHCATNHLLPHLAIITCPLHLVQRH